MIVCCGFTPRFVGTSDASATHSPSTPRTRPFGSQTERDGSAPITAPPNRCDRIPTHARGSMGLLEQPDLVGAHAVGQAVHAGDHPRAPAAKCIRASTTIAVRIRRMSASSRV